MTRWTTANRHVTPYAEHLPNDIERLARQLSHGRDGEAEGEREK